MNHKRHMPDICQVYSGFKLSGAFRFGSVITRTFLHSVLLGIHAPMDMHVQGILCAEDSWDAKCLTCKTH